MAPIGPLDQRSCPERKRGAERSSGVIGGSVLPRKARGHAATRIAPGICVSAGADADCRQSTELEPGALSWGQLLARAESAPPLPRSAGPTEAPPSRTIRSDASHPDPSPVASNLVASNDTADPSRDRAPPARTRPTAAANRAANHAGAPAYGC